MFRHVTHLEVLDSIDTQDWAMLPLIPYLTHFAFSSDHLLGIVGPVLLKCGRLECAIFHLDGTDGLWATQICAEWFLDDVRFAGMYEELDFTEDWKCGAENGYHFWVRADALVAVKRAAQVQCECTLGLPPVAVTATAVYSTAVFLLPETLTGRDGRQDGRRGRLDG
ncbi:hypothetical protein DFH09DRAFT_1101495 [Mycena vulgaris]|nr:hypothetical protein DFH09DRAFT_1101495 [Mycena vulgaris]